MGVSGRHGTIAFAKQTGKGTGATTPKFKCFFRAAPSLGPVKEVGRLPMTDSGRDQGKAFTSGFRVEGDAPIYLHPDGAALLFAAALGTNADSGLSPNFTHVATPASDMMWLTVWKMAANSVFEKYVDCKINTLTIESSAGNPVAVTLGIIGRRSTFEASEVAGTALASDPYVHMEGEGRIKIGGVAFPIDAYTWSLDNGGSGYQADGYGLEDVDPGGRTVASSFGMRFTNPTTEPKYREHFYGSDAGTELSPVRVVRSLDIEYLRDANTSVKLETPEIVYTAVPVQPDPGGDPIGVAVEAEVQKPAAAAITTATVKDQIATGV